MDDLASGREDSGEMYAAWVQYDPGRPEKPSGVWVLHAMEQAFFAGWIAAKASPPSDWISGGMVVPDRLEE